MKHLTCIFILLFYILNTSLGNVIRGNKQWVYSYKGQIDTKSSACNKSLARWTVSGKLTAQSLDNYMVFQLENLKTSLFNGDVNDLHLSEEKNIPLSAEILHKPFVVHKTSNRTIEVTPNEPLWSLNMKRAIGSHFQDNFNKEADEYYIEQSLYGHCLVKWTTEKIGEDMVVNKFINHKECKNSPFVHKTNVRRPEAIKDYDPLEIETVKRYFYKNISSEFVASDTYSISNITYRSMPSIPNTQNIDQYQEFKLISLSKVDKLINTEESTEKHDIIYEIDFESLYGRSKDPLNPEEQIKEFIKFYNEFDTEFNTSTLEHFDVRKEDNVENMFISLRNMKTDTLLKLNEQLKKRDDLLNVTFLTLIPYIGNDETTNFIIELFKNDLSFDDAQYLGIKFLATFPKYIENPTEETVKSLEILLDYKLSSNPVIKNAAILSFASIIQNAVDKSTISAEKFEAYKTLFFTKFRDEELFETRMMYLLSLINIGKSLKPDFIIPILTNTSELNHLRTLAISGFKKYLIHEPEKVFSNFWPIVQNEVESFDVRVLALDLLLSTNLSEKQFNTIVDVYRKNQKGVFNRHLFQYFHTTMQTLHNSTRYPDPLGALATDLFLKEDFPEYRLNFYAMLTSNFRLAYTDEEPNFGRSIQAQLIANPIMNTLNIIQLSYNYFAMSFDMGTYSVYFKFDNTFEIKYKEKIASLMQANVSISDLLKIIEDFNIKMKTETSDFHFEVVVFVDYQAIVAVHMYPGRARQISDDIGFNILQEKRISYPLMDYIGFPSDLGTSLAIKNDVQDITSGKRPTMELITRNYWYHQTWVESYNPIVSTPIASYKYYGQDLSISLDIDKSYYHQSLEFYHWNDSFQMINDKIIGTGVEDLELLTKFCPKCDSYYDISTDDHVDEKVQKYGLLTMSMNKTRSRHNDFTNTSNEYAYSFINSHYSIDNFATAKPLLLWWHFTDNQYYFQTDLQKISYRSIPYYQNTTMTVLKFKNHNKDKKLNPMYANTYTNFSLELISSGLDDDETKLRWELSFANQITTKIIDGIEKPKFGLTLDLDFVIYNETRFKVALDRELIFPKLNSDKFSIVPPEPTIGGINIRFCNLPEDADDCTTNVSTIILKEKFWISDKSINSVLESNDYKICQKEKIGFEFTPPTKSCILYTQRPMNQYDNYEMYAESYNVSGMNEHLEFDAPVLMYTLPDKNKMKLSLLKQPLTMDSDENKYWNVTFNYWQMYANPNAIAYNSYEVLMGVKRSCVITPNKIKTLTAKILKFDEKKPVAFIECFQKSLRGLTIQKINEKHIGFKFWASTNKLVVTFVDGKLKVNLNGNDIKETFYDEENKFKITFLDKHVILVDEAEVQIYYNTEYIFTKMLSIYNSRLCGFCSSDYNDN